MDSSTTRINLVLDWYKRNNYDLIGPTYTQGVGGQTLKYANVASMKSHGFEVTLSTRNIETKSFKWGTDFIFSKTKNEVTDLDSNTTIMDMISGSGFAMEGYPVRALFSMDFRGLNEQGLPTFINHEGKLTSGGADINFQERIKDYLVYEGQLQTLPLQEVSEIYSHIRT